MDQNAETFMINYTGHGDPHSGGWIVNMLEESQDATSGTVTIDDVLDIFTQSEFKGSMEISSDSPYSGKLCHAAKDYFTRNNLDELKLKYKIMGATNNDEGLPWNVYEQMLSERG